MQSFVNLCTAAGIDVARLELFDMYLFAGRIINDGPLCKGMLAAGTSREDVIAAMTQAERAALRDRVLGVVQFKQS
jgi:hypothetical protein